MIIDKMLTMYGKLLLVMYDSKVSMGEKFMIPFTQVELSEILKSNKTTVNNLFKEYEEDGLIIQKNRRYFFTEKALRIIKKIKGIKE